jgi:hypothetical protein
MKLAWCLPVAAWAAVVFAADEGKGTVVELGNLKSRAPASWKEEEPQNRMRLAQFRLPKVDGDKRDAEVIIFRGIGGSAEANVNRWKNQFIPPEGKTLDDVAKVSKMKVGDADVTYLDVHGTYKFKAQPFNPNAKEERLPDYRLVGVVFDTKEAPYHIRLVGPAKTVAHYKAGFDSWLKGFK